MKGTILERLFDKVNPGPERDSCWLWTGGTNRAGYGWLRVGNTSKLAHRVAFELFRFAIPKGLCVLHSCDNPPCVNPSHLSIGTQAENVRQMLERGRARRGEQRGEANNQSKLSENDVREIRSLRGLVTQRNLSVQFGISQSVVSDVQRRETWKHIA